MTGSRTTVVTPAKSKTLRGEVTALDRSCSLMPQTPLPAKVFTYDSVMNASSM